MQVAWYCECGAAWKGFLPDNVVAKFKAAWDSVHTGPGHALCDAKTASRARMKAEDEATREEK